MKILDQAASTDETGRKRGRKGRIFPAWPLRDHKKNPASAALPRRTGKWKK
jgi:hypothetical protein